MKYIPLTQRAGLPKSLYGKVDTLSRSFNVGVEAFNMYFVKNQSNWDFNKDTMQVVSRFDARQGVDILGVSVLGKAKFDIIPCHRV